MRADAWNIIAHYGDSYSFSYRAVIALLLKMYTVVRFISGHAPVTRVMYPYAIHIDQVGTVYAAREPSIIINPTKSACEQKSYI